MRPTALAAGPLVPTVDSQRPLAPCHDASTGTKLSRHAPPSAHPVQNSPGTRPRRPTRYKTLPARPKYLFSAHFAPAGRTLYHFHHHQAEQGEFSTAYGTTYGTKLSRHAPPAAPTSTKLSRHATLAAPTGTKLSQHAPPAAHPVQNSPSMPETPLFGAFCASRENFVPLPPPPSRAGRKKSRTGRAKRGGASPYNPRNALIAGISRTAWTRPAR